MPWQWPVGAVCVFVLALVTTPAGVSGAVRPLPVLGSRRLHRDRPVVTDRVRVLIWLTAGLVGCAGGIYGVGGGSLLAPILIAAGFSAYDVAPATLAATFVTSMVGIMAYEVLQSSHGGAIAPDWALGLWLGAGGFAGSYSGARLQRRLPEASIRRLLGLIACLVAIRYLQEATHPVHRSQPSAILG